MQAIRQQVVEGVVPWSWLSCAPLVSWLVAQILRIPGIAWQWEKLSHSLPSSYIYFFHSHGLTFQICWMKPHKSQDNWAVCALQKCNQWREEWGLNSIPWSAVSCHVLFESEEGMSPRRCLMESYTRAFYELVMALYTWFKLWSVGFGDLYSCYHNYSLTCLEWPTLGNLTKESG